MDPDKWLTLPCDLLVDIFRRLDAPTVIRCCAAACRPWRRTIIDNASSLQPRRRPDDDGQQFLPGLLLGFLEKDLGMGLLVIPWLHYVPASNTTPVPAFFTPTTSRVSVVIDGRLYGDLLSSRDGLLLLGHENSMFSLDNGDSLCLCTVDTGVCKIIPAAAIHNHHYIVGLRIMYVLYTGYDNVTDIDNGDETAVWMILAVRWVQDSSMGSVTNHQIFSSVTGAWGPVKSSSVKRPDGMDRAHNDPSSLSKGLVVVCRGVVSWFVHLQPNRDAPDTRTRRCLFSMDLRTERTWMTELPPHLGVVEGGNSVVLAVSEDGQVSLVHMLSSSRKMEVWVLVGDAGGQWTLRRRIDDVQKLIPNCPSLRHMVISGFCPRSGYLFGVGTDDRGHQQDFVIGVDGSSPRLTGTAEFTSSSAIRFPYEMDWSSYISSKISKMKYL